LANLDNESLEFFVPFDGAEASSRGLLHLPRERRPISKDATMDDIKVRGYIISSTIGYLRERVGDAEARRVISGLSPELNAVAGDIKSATWYPVSMVSELNRALVTFCAGGDQERAREVLAKCGNFMAKEATNTFLKLLMKMLTPNLFAKKLPDFWKRDCTGGRLVVDVAEERLTCRFFEVRGYDHIGAVAAGYVGFALEAMGKSIERTALHDWSLASPNVDGTWFEIFWKK
jgi:hypothetical protein